MKPYVPSADDLLEMSIAHFQQHAEELRNLFNKLTDEQKAALAKACRSIADMEDAA